VFKRPQVDLVNRRDYRFLPNEKKLSLNTLGKRIKVDYEDQHFEEYFDGTWSFGTGYRHHQTHEYMCDHCGYRSNDDRVGAMNTQYLGALWVSGEEHPHLDIRRK